MKEDQNEFEYNDGLGDLLREKEKPEFSWSKTLLIISSLVIIIFVSITAIFRIGESIFSKKKTASNDAQHMLEKAETFFDYEKEKERIEKVAALDLPRVQRKLSQPVSKQTRNRVSKLPYKVIVGTFTQLPNAKRLKASLTEKKVDSFIQRVKSNNQKIYRVQAGAFDRRIEAGAFMSSLKKLGFDAYVLVQ